MRLNPYSHITIEIRPYSKAKRARHKHGCTHLVRVYEREAYYPDPPRSGEDGVATEAGKILNIFEQEICSGDDSIGIANTLRRLGDWQRAPRKPARRRTGVYQDRSGKIQREGFQEVGGGFGSGADYREA